jgi:hypothetical protein
VLALFSELIDGSSAPVTYDNANGDTISLSLNGIGKHFEKTPTTVGGTNKVKGGGVGLVGGWGWGSEVAVCAKDYGIIDLY